jgi:hypothetical protein
MDQVIRNLERLANGEKVPLIRIATLTEVQLVQLNEARSKQGLSPMVADVLFVGRHVYKSRVLQDGYSLKDVALQIENAMSELSVIVAGKTMTSLENQQGRDDGYGNVVKDTAVFECSVRHPRPELFSVIPRGDALKPKKKGATKRSQ